MRELTRRRAVAGTFLRKVSRKARSLFRKTSSNVPRHRGESPSFSYSFFLLCRPPPRQTRNSRRDFDEIPRGLWTTVLGPTMASNLHPAATPGRYPNLFRLSCKLVGISKVAAIRGVVNWMRSGYEMILASGADTGTMNTKAKDNT